MDDIGNKADDSDIKTLPQEGAHPMLELQRSTARQMIGRHVQVACLDGAVIDGHLDWCSDCEIAVANNTSRFVIALDRIVGIVRRSG